MFDKVAFPITFTLGIMSTETDALNSCKYLYLNEIGEPYENALRLVVAEAVAEGKVNIKEHPTELANLLVQSKPIVHTSTCRTFEITWSNYIGYSVRNESFALPGEHEGKGLLLVEYTQSRYLEFIAASTFADADFPGPFTNWALYCLNHTIDVISTDAPVIRLESHSPSIND